MNKKIRKLEPVSFSQVRIKDGFWSPRLTTNRRVTLPIEYQQCKQTGRIDVWKWKPGKPNQPHIFWDSDVAKLIEAASYSLTTDPDSELEKKVDYAVNLIVQGQDKDGYLYCPVTGPKYQECQIIAVPYCLWGNRRSGAMLVWCLTKQ